ncbi:hypothetical protein [Dietzia sp. MNB45]|uniref:hypothetical protein n=1 Tax=Dietzia sp. MNB45 TaxID=3238800 RepID=UPI003F820CAD
MIGSKPPFYQFELFDNTGTALADITPYVEKPHYSMELNESEELTFSLDLFKFQDIAERLGVADPEVLLAEYATDVKIKRNGEYLLGTHVDSIGIDIGPDSATLSVTAFGYLEFFDKRLITKKYPLTLDSTSIARDMIMNTQSRPRGSFGVQLQPNGYSSGVLRDMNYQDAEIKREIIDLAESGYGPFEFRFSPDKKFQTYQRLGSDDGLILRHGDNLTGVTLDRLGSRRYNFIHGLGSGFGSDMLRKVAEDAVDQQRHYLREKSVQFNGVTNPNTLLQNTISELLLATSPAIPIVETNTTKLGGVMPHLGDTVGLDLTGVPYVAEYSGMYRVIKLDVGLDENAHEAISIYLGAA